MALPKQRYMATEYRVTVDGLSIGSIEYPFTVNLSPETINQLRRDVAHHYRVKPEGVMIERMTKQARMNSWVWSEFYRLQLKGQIS